MAPNRRTLLQLAGLGVGTALAGCLAPGDGGATTPTSTPPGTAPTISDDETMPFVVRSSAPAWRADDDAVGHVVLVDSAQRQRAALGQYDHSPDGIDGFLDDVDYATDRLAIVESVGPDGCHDALDVENVRLESGRIRADATVRDTSEGDVGCTEALVYPSTLLRVRFDGDPVDEAAIDVTDGRGESATVTASTDEPLFPDPANLSGHVRPDGDPEPISPLTCEGDGRRHDQWYDEADVQWGDFEHGGPRLSLRVDESSYEYGDTLRVDLTNVTDDSVQTGNREKYNLQVDTEAGWQDVRVRESGQPFEYTDEAVSHAPGGGFEWSFELTEDGIVADGFHGDAEVCPDLRAGRYRFAYFGVIGDGAVAVSFDLQR